MCCCHEPWRGWSRCGGPVSDQASLCISIRVSGLAIISGASYLYHTVSLSSRGHSQSMPPPPWSPSSLCSSSLPSLCQPSSWRRSVCRPSLSRGINVSWSVIMTARWASLLTAWQYSWQPWLKAWHHGNHYGRESRYTASNGTRGDSRYSGICPQSRSSPSQRFRGQE